MPHFLPTVWPGTVLQQPVVSRPAAVKVHDGQWLELLGPDEDVAIPTGFYLRELTVGRPRTAEDAAAFVQQWGRSADVDYRDLRAGEAHRRVYEVRAQREGLLTKTGSFLDKFAIFAGHDVDELVRVRTSVVHVAEVLYRAEEMSWLADHTLAWKRGDDRDEDAWTLYLEGLNAALSAFQVSMVVEGQDRPHSLPNITAYSVGALQLYNDVAIGATYRECANETCAVVFTTQRGTAAHYQRTSGTKYCTNKCARAQAERERRRRSKGAR